jgi:hypothetical protein
MKNFVFIFLFLPLFSFASFPINLNFLSSDTIIRNGKIYVDIGVDSLSKYPVEKETLTEYRERLKNQLNQEKFRSNTVYEKKPVDWTKIIIIFLVIGAIMSYILMKLMFDSINSSSWW